MYAIIQLYFRVVLYLQQPKLLSIQHFKMQRIAHTVEPVQSDT
jgi:hypothetical protein